MLCRMTGTPISSKRNFPFVTGALLPQTLHVSFRMALPPTNGKNCNQKGPIDCLKTEDDGYPLSIRLLAFDGVFPLACLYVLVGGIGDISVLKNIKRIWKCQILLVQFLQEMLTG